MVSYSFCIAFRFSFQRSSVLQHNRCSESPLLLSHSIVHLFSHSFLRSEADLSVSWFAWETLLRATSCTCVRGGAASGFGQFGSSSSCESSVLFWLYFLCIGWSEILISLDGYDRLALVVSAFDGVSWQYKACKRDLWSGYEVLHPPL